MFSSQIQELNAIRGAVEQSQTALAECLQFSIRFRDSNGLGFRPGPIAGASFNLAEVVAFAQRALRVFQSLKLDANSLVPRGEWASALQALNEIQSNVSVLVGQARAVTAETRPVSITNSTVVTQPESGTVVADFSAPAQALAAAVDRLADSSAVLASIVGASRAARNAQANEVLADDAQAAVQALSAVEEAAKTASAARQAALKSATETAAVKDSADKALTEGKAAIAQQQAALADALAQVAAASTTATDQAATTKSKLDEVTRLTAQAETSHTALASYTATLDATEKRVRAAEERAAAVATDMRSRTDRVAQLIQEAEKMVSGATAAGLAKAFADERNELEASMRWAYVGFVVGILALALFSTLVAAYVLNIPIELLGLHIPAQVKGANGYEVTIAGVLSRALVLVAPF